MVKATQINVEIVNGGFILSASLEDDTTNTHTFEREILATDRKLIDRIKTLIANKEEV